MRSKTSAFLLLALTLAMVLSVIQIHNARASSFNLPFYDDFLYPSVSSMTSAGWAICGTQSQISVGNGLLTLTNDGHTAGDMCWSNIPTGITSWTVTVKGQYSQALGGYSNQGRSLFLSLTTASHSYLWDLDGWYTSYYLSRDGVRVQTVGGYSSQIGTWHTLSLDMRNGVVSAIADGVVITSYVEAAGTNNALTGVTMMPGWESVTNYDYINIPFRDDFSYASVSSMVSAGWAVCGTQSQINVGNSLLSLTNDGRTAGDMCWNNIPAGVTRWTVSTVGQDSQALGGFSNQGRSIYLAVTTASHSYTWDLDGWYTSYYLSRDGVRVNSVGGYSSQLGAWHNLALDMNNGVLSAIADGVVIATYNEAGNSNNALTGVTMMPGWESVTNYDYITIFGVTTAVSIYSVQISANTLSGTTATISWSTSPSNSCDTFNWGTTTAYGNTNYPPCGTHSVNLGSLTPHQVYDFQIIASVTGNNNYGYYYGSFYTTDVSNSRAYEGYNQNPAFSTLCGTIHDQTNYSTESPGDVEFDPSQVGNANHYQVFDLHFHFDSLGQSYCWPWILGAKYTQVDLWVYDPSGAINWINSKGNIISSGYAGGSATVSWTIFFQGGTQNGQAGFSATTTPSSVPTVSNNMNQNLDQGGGWKYVGNFRFTWPMQVQVGFDVIVPMIVTDQQAQYHLHDIVNFKVQDTVTYDGFGLGLWAGHDQVLTYPAYLLGDGDYNGANQLDQYTDIQQGTSNGPLA